MRQTSVGRPQNRHLRPGRQQGVTNKATRVKQEILEGMTLSGHPAVDPKEHFLDILSNPDEEPARRDMAAATLLPYFHSKRASIVEASLQEPRGKVSKETVKRMARALLATEEEDEPSS